MARYTLILMLAAALAAGAGADAKAPKIRKPRPAPPGPSAMPPLPPAVLDDTLAIGGDDIKARKVVTRLTVEVEVNGRGPYHFLVDSGADTSAVGLSIARSLQLPLGTPVTLNGMTDRSIVDRVKVASLRVGPSVVTDLELPALREDDVGAQGVIGIDALVRRRLMMDFDRRIIKVEDAAKPPKSLPGEIVVVAQRRRGQLILPAVKAGDVKLDAVIDTGSEFTIGNLLLRDKLIRRGQRFEPVEAVGVTGKTVILQIARIPKLQIGQMLVRNLVVAFADLPPFEVFGLADEPALLLGTDLLKTFRRVSLDFHARKIRFQPRICESDHLIIRTSSSRISSPAGDCER
jgi:predicted aspartyl protease